MADTREKPTPDEPALRQIKDRALARRAQAEFPLATEPDPASGEAEVTIRAPKR